VGTIAPDGAPPCQMALDHVSGMTDRYALSLFEKIAMPDPWPQIGR